MCTVVTSWTAGEPLRILAVRDELVSRDFDEPAAWWPEHPGVIGGRDRQAGGSWCVSDLATGVTALVLNRVERRTGTPSRGVLPLAAVSAGPAWPEQVEHRAMAGFNLVLATPEGVTVWTWDTTELHRVDVPAGQHVVTSSGVDTDDPKTRRFAPQLAAQPWPDVLAGTAPEDDRSALVVRHPVGADVYATVFGQLITASPGRLELSYSRTPWQRATWQRQEFSA